MRQMYKRDGSSGYPAKYAHLALLEYKEKIAKTRICLWKVVWLLRHCCAYNSLLLSI